MPSSVLIADNSPVMRSIVERAIRIGNLPVSACYLAADGRAALRIAEAHPIDFLVTDIHMPEMDGEELIQALAARPQARPIPFLVASADASVGRIERMLALGASDYLLKPFSVSTLCTRLGKALEAAHAHN